MNNKKAKKLLKEYLEIPKQDLNAEINYNTENLPKKKCCSKKRYAVTAISIILCCFIVAVTVVVGINMKFSQHESVSSIFSVSTSLNEIENTILTESISIESFNTVYNCQILGLKNVDYSANKLENNDDIIGLKIEIKPINRIHNCEIFATINNNDINLEGFEILNSEEKFINENIKFSIHHNENKIEYKILFIHKNVKYYILSTCDNIGVIDFLNEIFETSGTK